MGWNGPKPLQKSESTNSITMDRPLTHLATSTGRPSWYCTVFSCPSSWAPFTLFFSPQRDGGIILLNINKLFRYIPCKFNWKTYNYHNQNKILMLWNLTLHVLIVRFLTSITVFYYYNTENKIHKSVVFLFKI